MILTEAMLEAAIRKATEAGLFRRHSSPCEMTANREVMQEILKAALAETDVDFMDAALQEPGMKPTLSIVRSLYK